MRRGAWCIGLRDHRQHTIGGQSPGGCSCAAAASTSQAGAGRLKQRRHHAPPRMYLSKSSRAALGAPAQLPSTAATSWERALDTCSGHAQADAVSEQACAAGQTICSCRHQLGACTGHRHTDARIGWDGICCSASLLWMPPTHGLLKQAAHACPMHPAHEPACMSARSRRRPSSSRPRCCSSCCRSGSCSGAASLQLRLPLLPVPGRPPEPSAARSMELSRGTCKGRG